MSKELDNVLSDTFKEYIELVGEPAKPTLKKRIVDSCMFKILFFPILNLIDDLKTLKHQLSVDTSDIICIWMLFLLTSLIYIMGLVVCGAAVYKFCTLPSVTQIIIASIVVISISIVTIPVWVIRKWVNKK
jgi:hypothetical protein